MSDFDLIRQAVDTAETDANNEADAWQAKLTAANATITDLQAKLAALQPKPAPQITRFPGDPGPGKIVVGAIVSGGAGNADTWEKTTGAKLGAHRTYYNNGVADIAPTGPALAYCKTEHAAGRIPQVSFKLGRWADIAAGKYDTQLKAFRDAIEALGKPVDVMFQHEPQNDLGSLGTATEFVAAQERIRAAIGTGLKRLSFGGSLMCYGWTAQGASKFGPVDAWFPKPGTWDWCGGDQYAQTSGAPIDDGKLAGFIASCTKHEVLPAITELGIRSADPTGPAKLKALFDKLVAAGFVKVDWYNSNNNSTGDGWVLTGPLLEQFVALCKDPRAARPAA